MNVRELLLISSGTLATLTGENNYEKLDEIQAALIAFYLRTKANTEYETWMDVWTTFSANI